jgi:menaquinone-specific isochorismate synthase
VRVLSRQATGRFTARTVAIPDPGDLLAGLPRPDVVAWVHHGAGLAGWGEAFRVTLPAGEDRFTAGEKWLRSVFDVIDTDDQVGVRGSGPLAFGGFTFDASSDGSVLIIPRLVAGRDGHGRAWLTTVSEAGRPDPARAEPAQAELAALPASGPAPVPPAGLTWRDGSLPGPRWEQAVAQAVAVITGGSQHQDGLRKVVLARDVFATAAEPIDARVLLRRLAARYPDCFTFACDGMVGATPELLVRRDGRQVSALVLGGTLPRGASPAEDDALGAELLASAKNNEEHAYAVASIRDGLAPLCDELETEAQPALLKYPNLQHLGTWIAGTMAAGEAPRSALALAGAVHPPAAVCGTPPASALELIRELEQMDRERYAGPVGWVDAEGNG